MLQTCVTVTIEKSLTRLPLVVTGDEKVWDFIL